MSIHRAAAVALSSMIAWPSTLVKSEPFTRYDEKAAAIEPRGVQGTATADATLSSMLEVNAENNQDSHR